MGAETALGGFGVLSAWIDAMSRIVGGGFDRTIPIASAGTFYMTVLALIAAAISIGIGKAGMGVAATWLAIKAAFFNVVVTNSAFLAKFLMVGFVEVGLIVGGRPGLSPEQFLNSPDSIVLRGYGIANSLFDLAADVCKTSSWGCLGTLDSWSPMFLAAWAVIIVFAMAGVAVLCCAILFMCGMLFGIVVLPFSIFDKTSSYGGGPIKLVLHSGVQLAVLALFTSLGEMAFLSQTLKTVPGVDSALPYFVGALALGALVVGAGTFAYKITSGGIQEAGALFGAGGGMVAAGVRGGTQRVNDLAERGAIKGASALYNKSKAGLTYAGKAMAAPVKQAMSKRASA